MYPLKGEIYEAVPVGGLQDYIEIDQDNRRNQLIKLDLLVRPSLAMPHLQTRNTQNPESLALRMHRRTFSPDFSTLGGASLL